MLKLSKWVAVVALGLATLGPGLAAAADRVVVRAEPVGYFGRPVVVERVRVGPYVRPWHRWYGWRREHGRRYWRY
jgi:hypothetical protein